MGSIKEILIGTTSSEILYQLRDIADTTGILLQ